MSKTLQEVDVIADPIDGSNSYENAFRAKSACSGVIGLRYHFVTAGVGPYYAHYGLGLEVLP
jgi:hypothetical protein